MTPSLSISRLRCALIRPLIRPLIRRSISLANDNSYHSYHYRQLKNKGIGNGANKTVVRSIGFAPISPKTLSQIVDLDKLMKEDRATVEAIWTSYHEDKVTSASAMVLNKDEGEAIKTRAKISPLFIVPVFKSSSLDSFVMLISQYQENGGFILTYLEEYRRRPDTATPWMSLMLYSDLQDTKDITLLRSDFTANVSKKENTAISRMIVDSYLYNDVYGGYVYPFNKKPDKFDFDKYLELFKSKYSSSFT